MRCLQGKCYCWVRLVVVVVMMMMVVVMVKMMMVKMSTFMHVPSYR